MKSILVFLVMIFVCSCNYQIGTYKHNLKKYNGGKIIFERDFNTYYPITTYTNYIVFNDGDSTITISTDGLIISTKRIEGYYITDSTKKTTINDINY